jgi:hypothetical protein
MINSTLNVSKRNISYLQKMKSDKQILFSEILICYIDHSLVFVKNIRDGAVRYQSRVDEDSWNIVHVSFEESRYNLFTAARFFLKMSLSLIFAKAIEYYMSLSNEDNESDNYFEFCAVSCFDEMLELLKQRFYGKT